MEIKEVVIGQKRLLRLMRVMSPESFSGAEGGALEMPHSTLTSRLKEAKGIYLLWRIGTLFL